jgi:hypothetical protein
MPSAVSRSPIFPVIDPGWLYTGEIAFDVRHEYRYAARAEILSQTLQRYSFTRCRSHP